MNLEKKNKKEVEDFIIDLYNRRYVEDLVISSDEGITDCTIVANGLSEDELSKAKSYNLPIVWYNPNF